MRIIHNVWGIALFVSFCIMGCSTAPAPVPYSFAGNTGETISITFSSQANLVSFEGVVLPKPARKTHWRPIVFPAGRTLPLTVHAYYDDSWGANLSTSGTAFDILLLVIFPVVIIHDLTAPLRGINRDVVFDCPPLQAGREYFLTLEKKGRPKRFYLILSDTQTGVVYEQQIERK